MRKHSGESWETQRGKYQKAYIKISKLLQDAIRGENGTRPSGAHGSNIWRKSPVWSVNVQQIICVDLLRTTVQTKTINSEETFSSKMH